MKEFSPFMNDDDTPLSSPSPSTTITTSDAVRDDKPSIPHTTSDSWRDTTSDAVRDTTSDAVRDTTDAVRDDIQDLIDEVANFGISRSTSYFEDKPQTREHKPNQHELAMFPPNSYPSKYRSPPNENSQTSLVSQTFNLPTKDNISVPHEPESDRKASSHSTKDPHHSPPSSSSKPSWSIYFPSDIPSPVTTRQSPPPYRPFRPDDFSRDFPSPVITPRPLEPNSQPSAVNSPSQTATSLQPPSSPAPPHTTQYYSQRPTSNYAPPTPIYSPPITSTTYHPPPPPTTPKIYHPPPPPPPTPPTIYRPPPSTTAYSTQPHQAYYSPSLQPSAPSYQQPYSAFVQSPYSPQQYYVPPLTQQYNWAPQNPPTAGGVPPGYYNVRGNGRP